MFWNRLRMYIISSVACVQNNYLWVLHGELHHTAENLKSLNSWDCQGWMHSASVCMFMGCLRRSLRLFSETASFQYSFLPQAVKTSGWHHCIYLFLHYFKMGSGFLWEIIRYGLSQITHFFDMGSVKTSTDMSLNHWHKEPNNKL